MAKDKATFGGARGREAAEAYSGRSAAGKRTEKYEQAAAPQKIQTGAMQIKQAAAPQKMRAEAEANISPGMPPSVKAAAASIDYANNRTDEYSLILNESINNRTRSDEIAEQLAVILEQESALYRDASDISIKKTDIIVNGKIEELDSLVKAEQMIIIKIGKLEEERELIVRALSDEIGLDLEGATLSRINSHLSAECYARLDACQKNLAQTLGGLKNTNDMNAQLIQNALDYVNFSVNLLTTNQTSGNLYSQDGDEGATHQRRPVFDVKL